MAEDTKLTGLNQLRGKNYSATKQKLPHTISNTIHPSVSFHLCFRVAGYYVQKGHKTTPTLRCEIKDLWNKAFSDGSKIRKTKTKIYIFGH